MFWHHIIPRTAAGNPRKGWRDGSLAGKNLYFPATPVVSVDTTGAGDAFVAGLLAALAAEGMPSGEQALASVIEQAQRCGALATTAKVP